MDLIERIVNGYNVKPGKGLPIGSLTSQHFANYYLSGVDRFIMETMKVRGFARYMDDMIWWCNDKRSATNVLAGVKSFVRDTRMLEIKDAVQINRSDRGVPFCGYRIFPCYTRLSRRRMRRYARRRKYWERMYEKGIISSSCLQQAFAAVKGIVAHADCREWMRSHLQRNPEIDA